MIHTPKVLPQHPRPTAPSAGKHTAPDIAILRSLPRRISLVLISDTFSFRSADICTLYSIVHDPDVGDPTP